MIGIVSILAFGVVGQPSLQGEDKVVRVAEATLATGIPGKGPLAEAEIRKWLSDQAVHETIAVELPLGLAMGKDAIQIPADNPLTRAKIELGDSSILIEGYPKMGK